MPVHYLLHEATFLCSHDFQTLHLGKFLHLIDKKEDEIALVNEGIWFKPHDPTVGYRHRPSERENIWLYEYTEKYVLANAPNRKSSTSTADLNKDPKKTRNDEDTVQVAKISQFKSWAPTVFKKST